MKGKLFSPFYAFLACTLAVFFKINTLINTKKTNPLSSSQRIQRHLFAGAQYNISSLYNTSTLGICPVFVFLDKPLLSEFRPRRDRAKTAPNEVPPPR